MWLVLTLILSGTAVGLGFLFRCIYSNKVKKYKKLTKYREDKLARNETSDGFVFVCPANDSFSKKSAPRETLTDCTLYAVGRDSDYELIEEIDKMIPIT